MLPKAVEAIGLGVSSEDLTNQLIKIGRLSQTILLYVIGAFLLLGKEFIILWIGSKYIEAWNVALIIMLVYLIPLAQGYTHSLLEAKNLHRVKSILFFITTVLGVALGKVLSDLYGIIGMVTGISVSQIILHIILNFYYHKKIGINIPLFFKKAILPFLIPYTLILFFNFYACLYINSGWLLFTIKSIIYTITYIPLIYLIVLNNDEKLLFKGVLKFK